MSLKHIKNSLLARASINSYISDFDDDSKTSLGVDSQKKSRSIFAGLVRNRNQNGDSPTLFQSAEKKIEEPDVADILSHATKNKINRINRLFLDLKSSTSGSEEAKKYARKIEAAISTLKLVNLPEERKIIESGRHVSERFFSSSTLTNFACAKDASFFNCYNNIEVIKKDEKANLCSEMLWRIDLEEDFLCTLNCGRGNLKETVICGTIEGGLKVWELKNTKPLRIYPGKRKFYDCFSHVFNSGFSIYAGNYKGNIKIFDLRMKDSLGLLVAEKEANEPTSFSPITSLDKSNDHNLLSTQQDFLSLWDLRIPKEITRIAQTKPGTTQSEKEPFCLKACFLEEGNQALILNRGEKEVAIWDLVAKRKKNSFNFKDVVCDFDKIKETGEIIVLTENTSKEKGGSKIHFLERKKEAKFSNYDSIEFARKFTKLSNNEYQTSLFDGSYLSHYSHSKIEEMELVRSELRENLKL